VRIEVGRRVETPEGLQGIGTAWGPPGSSSTTNDVHGRRRLPAVKVPVDRVVGGIAPSRVGPSEITNHLERLEIGAGNDDDVRHGLTRVADGNRSHLAVEEQLVVDSIMQAFSEEFAEHVELGRCPHPRRLPIHKLVDLADGTVVHDDAYWRKRSDWT
jgi:hypothetical protein